MWEYGFGFCVLPDPPVQAFDNISCVYDFSDFQRVIKELGQLYPVLSPGSDSISIFMVPFLFKVIQGQLEKPMPLTTCSQS